jgi:hypothetical protein
MEALMGKNVNSGFSIPMCDCRGRNKKSPNYIDFFMATATPESEDMFILLSSF